MFEYIQGKMVVKNIEYIAIDISGLAYKIYIPFKTYDRLGEIGDIEKLYIHTNVKEDDISYYGFYSKEERAIFEAVITLNGVGVKLAIAILSTFSYTEIVDIVMIEDDALLSKVPGIGIKKAKKIILDLKDKVKKLSLYEDNNIKNNDNIRLIIIKEELILGLSSLGYNKIDISKYIEDEEILSLNSTALAMKKVLKSISNNERKK